MRRQEVGAFVVDGKVSSLNSYLTPDSEVYEIGGETTDNTVYYNGTSENDWLADVDGRSGNVPGDIKGELEYLKP